MVGAYTIRVYAYSLSCTCRLCRLGLSLSLTFLKACAVANFSKKQQQRGTQFWNFLVVASGSTATALTSCNNSVKWRKLSYQELALAGGLSADILLLAFLACVASQAFHTVTFLIYDYDYPATQSLQPRTLLKYSSATIVPQRVYHDGKERVWFHNHNMCILLLLYAKMAVSKFLFVFTFF